MNFKNLKSSFYNNHILISVFIPLFTAGTILFVYFFYFQNDTKVHKYAFKEMKMLKIENSKIKMTCIPRYGGRIVSVLDKVNHHDLLKHNHIPFYKNPAAEGNMSGYLDLITEGWPGPDIWIQPYDVSIKKSTRKTSVKFHTKRNGIDIKRTATLYHKRQVPLLGVSVILKNTLHKNQDLWYHEHISLCAGTENGTNDIIYHYKNGELRKDPAYIGRAAPLFFDNADAFVIYDPREKKGIYAHASSENRAKTFIWRAAFAANVQYVWHKDDAKKKETLTLSRTFSSFSGLNHITAFSDDMVTETIIKNTTNHQKKTVCLSAYILSTKHTIKAPLSLEIYHGKKHLKTLTLKFDKNDPLIRTNFEIESVEAETLKKEQNGQQHLEMKFSKGEQYIHSETIRL